MTTLGPRVDAAPRTAVVVVDIQNDFCHPRGGLARAGADISVIDPLVGRLESFIGAARAAGALIVFIQTTHDSTVDSAAWRRRTERADDPASVRCQTGTWGAGFYRVAPAPQDIVVTKHRFSAFVGTDLDDQLRKAGVTSLLVTGVATEVCVFTTLADGLFRDYDVALVEDCCGSYLPDRHRATVDSVRDHFGAVTTSGQVTESWR